MTIPPEQWQQHKAEIINLYIHCNIPLLQVITQMKANYGFKAGKTAYKEQLKIWKEEGDIEGKHDCYFKNETCVALVRHLWHEGYSHPEILEALQDHEGFPDITDWQLRDLRKRHGLPLARKKRYISQEDLEKVYECIEECLESGQGAQWGIDTMLTYVRKELDIFASRPQVWQILKALDPKGVKKRRLDEVRKRRRFMVKGPNRVWSVDGHDKLSGWGFQIYGIIDAYSRRILGMWVTISNRTTIAVQKFYLKTVRANGFPKLVRSDKGTETVLMATCQYSLRRNQKPGISVKKAFGYGTSTKNQRIEKFWKTLLSGQTQQWRDYFQALNDKDKFDGSKFDIIALQYIYMETIRRQIATFIEVYNSHKIRPQKSRDFYLPSGRPNKMYFHPRNTRNYATPADPALLASFEAQVDWYDDDKYLHDDTRRICDELFAERGYSLADLKLKPGMETDHVQMYLDLREDLYSYELAGKGEVKELSSPRGSSKLIEIMVEKREALAESLRRQRVRTAGNQELGNEEEMVDEGDENISEDEEDYFELGMVVE